VLRGIFGPKREEVAGGWRTLYSDELHNLYTSPNVIRQINLRRMGLAVQVAHGGVKRNAYILVGKQEEKKTTWKS
jgi:hypothetical protein